jgi:hypothetical protein
MLLYYNLFKPEKTNVLLAVYYVYFPLISIFFNALNLNFPRNTIDLALLIISVPPFLRLILGKIKNNTNVPIWFVLTILSLLFLIFTGYVFDYSPLPTALLEAKPLIYLLISILLIVSRKEPKIIDFCRYGSILSIILIFESLIRSLASGSLVRPVGSGEVNYDAALILLSLVFSLSNKSLFTRYSPLLILGIIASFSRTSLLVMCLIFFIIDFVPVKYRILAISFSVTAGILSFAIRGLELNSLENMDRYWMWVSGLEYIARDFILSAVFFAPGSALDINVPIYVEQLWLNQQDSIGTEGIFPFHLHAFWLRLLVGWGWLPVLFVLLFLLINYFKRSARIEDKSYILACLVLGLTMGLFYLSNVSVPYFIAGFILFNKRGRLQNLNYI